MSDAEMLDRIDAIGKRLEERLSDLERRLKFESESQQNRMDLVSRERAALQASQEENQHHIRLEYLKELRALQARFVETVAEHRGLLEALNKRQDEGGHAVESLADQVAKVLDRLNQPQDAKDQLVEHLEREKKDLMHALRERTEQLRKYSAERSEVEKSMGETMMQMTREAEVDRTKAQDMASRVSDLQLQLDIARKDLEQKAAYIAALEAQREELSKALALEAEKVRRQIAAQTQSDSTWSDRLAQANELLAAERDARLRSDEAAADLRHQLQTLTDHITRTLQERDHIEAQSAGWRREREELLATLRKKDEMVAMLSSTFQNMLKK